MTLGTILLIILVLMCCSAPFRDGRTAAIGATGPVVG